MSASIYVPLDQSKLEIRLLKVRYLNGQVNCTMTTHSLDDNPRYAALSYVWGNPSITTPVIVNGRSVLVTTNLEAALRRFSTHFDDIFYLWADALCIDQNNVPERNAQVQMMKYIYKSCVTVMGWLGREQGRSTQVLQLLRRISQALEPGRRGDVEALSDPITDGFLGDVPLHGRLTVRSLLTLTLSLEKDIKALAEEREFWKRSWIFQEILLPPLVVLVCGDEFCRYDHLINLCLWLLSTSETRHPTQVEAGDWFIHRQIVIDYLAPSVRLEHLRRNLIRPSEESAWTFFMYSMPRLVSRPEDKIYSLLGLVDIGIPVDYSKSASDVYHDFARAMMPKIPLDTWLSYAATHQSEKLPGLSSWVIDWDYISKHIGRLGEFINEDLYKADHGMPEAPNPVRVDGDKLRLTGVVIDQIESLATLSGGPGERARASIDFDISGGLGYWDRILSSPVPPGIPRGQACLRLCLQDLGPPTYQKDRIRIDTDGHKLMVLFSQFLARIAPQSLLADLFSRWGSRSQKVRELFLSACPVGVSLSVSVDRLNTELRHMIVQVTGYLAGSRHFYTKNGYLGSAGSEIEAELSQGDLVCVVLGCRVPIILRRTGEGFTFVKVCLLLGFLDGEASELVRKREREMEEFVIH